MVLLYYPRREINMYHTPRILAFFVAALAAASPSAGQSQTKALTDAEVQARVDGLLKQMTLTEKIAQIQFPNGETFAGL